MTPLINKPPTLSCFLLKEITLSKNREQMRGLNGAGWKRIHAAWGLRSLQEGQHRVIEMFYKKVG